MLDGNYLLYGVILGFRGFGGDDKKKPHGLGGGRGGFGGLGGLVICWFGWCPETV